MIVADTNITAYLALRSPYSELAIKLYARDPHWIVPVLWRSEIIHVLMKHINHSLMTLSQAMLRLGRLEAVIEDQLYEVTAADVLKLAEHSGSSSYDCEFVVLARQMNCQLVTMDKKLVKAFPESARLLSD